MDKSHPPAPKPSWQYTHCPDDPPGDADRAPQVFAVVDECALRRPIGEPSMMHQQLHHVLGAAEQPHVTLWVIPLAAEAADSQRLLIAAR
ncbi:MAG: Scr1 family TA system antitoxin-like transcriptional regulator [Pseudonocardiaceae bacterium]